MKNYASSMWIAVLFVAFWGEPDLVDVIIKYIESVTK